MPHQRVAQCVHLDSVAINGDANNLQPVIAKDVERQEIRGLLDEDRVAGLGESRADQIERLRRAARHH